LQACDPKETEIRSPAKRTLRKERQPECYSSSKHRRSKPNPRLFVLVSLVEHFNCPLDDVFLIPLNAPEKSRHPPFRIENVDLDTVSIHQRLDKVDAQFEMLAK